ncbi:redoxin domain-containing protein [bacterium]|nr:redoxin domain-containing protein [bacterium]
MKFAFKALFPLFSIVFIASCKFGGNTLPYMNIERVEGADTVFNKIPDFSFTNQNGEEINKQSLKGKVYVADFFFVSCPTICPVMAKNLKKVYERFGNNDKFMILSHTIDPRHDSVEVLKNYANRLGVAAPAWQFVTGKKDEIYQIGYDFYMATIEEDDSEGSGGYLHSGGLILVDSKGRIRGVYDGTNEAQVGQLISDLSILLK